VKIKIVDIKKIVQEELASYFGGMNESTTEEKRRACMRMVFSDVEKIILNRINRLKKADKGELHKVGK
jgi:hypothetical protein